MVARVIEKLEGLLQDLRDKRPTERDPEDRRPKAMAVHYVASHLGCSAGTVKRWLAYHSKLVNSEELSALFVEVYGCIANEFAEALALRALKIAHNSEHPSAFAALKWLLPIEQPEVFGGQSVEFDGEEDSDIVETEVMEALTPEQRERIEQLDEELEARNREVDNILREGKKQAQAATQDDRA